MILRHIYRNPKREIRKLKQENTYLREKAHQYIRAKEIQNQELEELKKENDNLVMERSRNSIKDVRVCHFIQEIQEENKKLKEEQKQLKKRMVELLHEKRILLTESIENYEKQQRKTGQNST